MQEKELRQRHSRGGFTAYYAGNSCYRRRDSPLPCTRGGLLAATRGTGGPARQFYMSSAPGRLNLKTRYDRRIRGYPTSGEGRPTTVSTDRL